MFGSKISTMKNTLFIILFAAVSLFTFSARAQSLQPGLWKTKSVFIVSGITLPSSEGEDCVTPEEAKDIKSTITKELKKNGCTLDSWKTKASILESSLTCKNDELDAKGTLSGPFTAKTYTLSGKANGVLHGSIPASADIKLTGAWTKECAH